MYSPIQKIDFPITNNLYENGRPSNVGNAYEMLLVNGVGHYFHTNNMEDLLYRSCYQETKEKQAMNFVENLLKMHALWRPIDCVQECAGKYTINLTCDYTYSTLVHTGPWKMSIGDHVYVLPPLQSVTSMMREASPYCFRYGGGGTFVHPMLLNKSEFVAFKADYYGVSMDESYQLKSHLGKCLGQDAMGVLKEVRKNVLANVTSIGQIIGKQDVFGSDNNEVNPETKFKIKWSSL